MKIERTANGISKKSLQKIKTFNPVNYKDEYLFETLLDAIAEFFKPYGNSKKITMENKVVYELITGGWSENEEIVMALQENYLFWGLCWQESVRGGRYEFSCYSKAKRKVFDLVLSGGGALGFAHIGLVKYLKEINVSPDFIHGVSMGAVVAAITAFNIDDSVYKDIQSILKWMRPSFTGKEIVSGRKIENLLSDHFKDVRIGDTKTKLFIYATDFETGERFLFPEDTLVRDAVYCSMAIPAIFPKKIINGRVYVDGYISGNTPLSNLVSDKILVSNVVGEGSIGRLDKMILKEMSASKSIERSIRMLINNQFQMEEVLTCKHRDCFVIDYPLSAYNTSQFWKGNEIIKEGYDFVKKSKVQKFLT